MKKKNFSKPRGNTFVILFRYRDSFLFVYYQAKNKQLVSISNNILNRDYREKKRKKKMIDKGNTFG